LNEGAATREKNAGVETPAALILSWVKREVNRTIKLGFNADSRDEPPIVQVHAASATLHCTGVCQATTVG
jgi:hypothetical protein